MITVDFNKLERAFYPQTVVVVGDSKQSNYEWLHGQRQFKGKLYSVHINPAAFEDIKAMGIENYTSLLDVPGPIDLVIVAVARKDGFEVFTHPHRISGAVSDTVSVAGARVP